MKRIIAAACAAALIFGAGSALPQVQIARVSAEGVTASGDYEYIVLDDGTAELINYYGSDTSVKLPDSINGTKVTSIGSYMFFSNWNIKSVTIPEGVKSIGENAFACCDYLESISIPKSVTEIGYAAFADTAWLKKQRQADALVTVNDILIDGKTCKGDITIPDGVKEISIEAFFECEGITTVTIPKSVERIGDSAFDSCGNLKGIIIKGAANIGASAFEDCESLTKADIQSGVTSVEEYAFYGCKSLKSVTIPKSVKEIGEYAFGYYDDGEGGTGKAGSFTIKGVKGTAAETYAKDNGFTFEQVEETSIKGDVNADGAINMADLTRLQQYLAEWEVTIDENAAEVTGDGKIGMADLTRLQQYLAEWEVTLG